MFLDIKFPENISFNAVGGAEFSTNVTILNNGFEHRNVNWNYPRHVYKVNFDVLDERMVEELRSFFLISKGKAHSFRFKDWLDHKGTSQINFQSNTNDSKIFQIVKIYQVEDNKFERKIKKLIKNTVLVKIDDGKILQEEIDYKIDYNEGTIEFLNEQEGEILIDFEFDVQVRFDSDLCEINSTKLGIYNWRSIKLIEVFD